MSPYPCQIVYCHCEFIHACCLLTVSLISILYVSLSLSSIRSILTLSLPLTSFTTPKVLVLLFPILSTLGILSPSSVFPLIFFLSRVDLSPPSPFSPSLPHFRKPHHSSPLSLSVCLSVCLPPPPLSLSLSLSLPLPPCAPAKTLCPCSRCHGGN